MEKNNYSNIIIRYYYKKLYLAEINNTMI